MVTTGEIPHGVVLRAATTDEAAKQSNRLIKAADHEVTGPAAPKAAE